jgi:peroxin-3
VEHEITFEREERRTKYVSAPFHIALSNEPLWFFASFLSALLPSTPETLHHLLTQGGVSSTNAQHITNQPNFRALLDETRALISSQNFSRVLEAVLDRATEILFVGLDKNIFVKPSNGTMGGGGSSCEEEKMRLAALLPGLARWSHLALNGLPNELIDVGRPT